MNHDHGKLWSVEGFFSAVKRCFGETVKEAKSQGDDEENEKELVL